MELKRRGGAASMDDDHIHDAEKTRPCDAQQGGTRTSDTAGLMASTESRAISVATAVLRPTLPWLVRDGPET